MKHKVEIINVSVYQRNIQQDGVVVGHITSYSASMGNPAEVHVHLTDNKGENHYVARFKYVKPQTKAYHWVKTVLSVLTPEQVIARLVNMAPTHLADQITAGTLDTTTSNPA